MIVAERNEPVHHLWPKLDRTSLESCLKMSTYLDGQSAKVLPVIENLKADCKSVHESMTLLFEFLKTEQGIKMLRPPETDSIPSPKPKRRRRRSKRRSGPPDGRPGHTS
jgi:hypothetical protein